MKQRVVGAHLLVLLGLSSGCDDKTTPNPPTAVRVAAASDLALAFEELGAAFEREYRMPITFSFGSSGLLAKQILEGAPFDLFAAASLSFVERTVASGACDKTTVTPHARGRIVLWSKPAAGAEPPTSLTDLEDPRFVRIALANPEHAPYGQAGREALESLGLWEKLKPRLVLGENVRQALQFAQTENASAAIVALSLVATDGTNPWTLIDDALHRPIEQTLVVCERGSNRAGAVRFLEIMNSKEGRAIMNRHGFSLPGEGMRLAR